MVVIDDQVYMSASNPNLNAAGVNVFPALVRATLHGGHGGRVDVVPVLFGNAHAIDLPTDSDVQLNLTDPDSMTVDPRGNVVLDSQADGELVFVRNPGTTGQEVGRIQLTLDGQPTTVDDTAFAPSGHAYLLVTDVGGDTIYRLDSAPFGFEPGTAYSSSDTAGFVAVLNLDNGVLTPVATGFKSTRGMLFVTSSH